MNTKKQILIANDSLKIWREDVNDHLLHGWLVVPNTMIISSAGTGAYPTNSYAIVLELEYDSQ